MTNQPKNKKTNIAEEYRRKIEQSAPSNAIAYCCEVVDVAMCRLLKRVLIGYYVSPGEGNADVQIAAALSSLEEAYTGSPGFSRRVNAAQIAKSIDPTKLRDRLSWRDPDGQADAVGEFKSDEISVIILAVNMFSDLA